MNIEELCEAADSLYQDINMDQIPTGRCGQMTTVGVIYDDDAEKRVMALYDGLTNFIEEEYARLKEDQALLNALRAEGVDNWEGWDSAIDRLEDD